MTTPPPLPGSSEPPTRGRSRPSPSAEAALLQFRATGDPAYLGEVFDRTAPQIQATARKAVPDLSAADDLVQCTFLAALEGVGNFREGEKVMPWLSGILKNQVRMWHRREERRGKALERAAETRGSLAEEVATDPAAGATGHELEREIQQRLSSLPSTYRPVVQLAVMHGLNAGEIAAALERPAGTVRTQLVRGLRLLREKLPAGLTGALAGILASESATASQALTATRSALLTRADLVVTGVVASTSSLWLTGVFAMKNVVLAVTVTGLLAVSWLLHSVWNEHTPPDPLETSNASTEDPEPSVTASDPVVDVEEAALDAGSPNTAPVTSPPVVLTGSVVDAGGIPVEGATVLLWDRGIARVWEVDGVDDPAPMVIATTDESGNFRLERRAWEAPGAVFLLRARKGDLSCEHGLFGRADGRASITGMKLVLVPTVVQHGRLVDHLGNPVPDFPFGSYAGYSTSAHHQTNVPGVRIINPAYLRVRTDEKGEFSVRAVADFSFRWEIQHPDHPMLRVHHKPADGFLELKLEKGQAVRGRVYLAGGDPAEGAKVELHDWPMRRTVVDSSGWFELRGADLREASYLMVSHEDAAVQVVQPVTADEEISVVLEEPAPLRGRVLRPDGTGIEGAVVRAVGERIFDPGAIFSSKPTWEWALDHDKVTTDSDGNFELPRLYRGEFRLDVTGPEGLLTSSDIVTPTDTVRLVLDPEHPESVTFTGRCIDALTDQPVTQFEVVVWRYSEADDDMTGRRFGVDDPDGRFEKTGERTGEIYLQVRAPGYASWSGEPESFSAGTYDFDVRVYPGRDVTLRLGSKRSAFRGCWLNIFDPDGNKLPFSLISGNTNTGVSLGGAEQLHLLGLPARPVTFRVTRDLAIPSEQIVDLTSPRQAPIVLRLPEAQFEVFPIRVFILCHEKGKDPHHDISEVFDLTRIGQLDGFWHLDRNAKITVEVEDEAIAWADVRVSESNEQYSVSQKSRLKPGTSSTSRTRSRPVHAGLHGVRAPMTVRIEAEGYRTFEQQLSLHDLQEAERLDAPAFITVWLEREQ